MENRFASALKKRGLTPVTVAEMTGIPLPTVQKHFYGTRNIGFQSLAKYKSAGIPPSEIFPDLFATDGDSCLRKIEPPQTSGEWQEMDE